MFLPRMFRSMFRSVTPIIIVLSFAMNGCGGGGDDVQMPGNRPDVSPPRQRPVMLPALHDLRAEDVVHAPIVQVEMDSRDGGRLHVGPGVHPSRNALAQIVEHGEISVFHGYVQDGYVRDSILGGDLGYYLALDSIASESPMRFAAEPPTVRIAGDPTSDMVSDLILTIQQINAALPADWQIQYSPEPSFSGGAPDGVVVVSFNPNIDTPGVAHTTPHNDAIVAATVIVQPHYWSNNQRHVGRHVLAHELLHALGRGHADPKKFPNTIMHSNIGVVLDGHILHPLDRDALTAMYSFAEPHVAPSDFPDYWLGHWSDTSMHFRGDFAGHDLAFGIASRNGLVQPWANGPHPWTQLADNPGLTGNASWDGRLLGLTPASEPVAGDVGLLVNLTTYGGQLDFNGLEYWLAGAIPGPVGSGLLWGDGDLAYTVDIRGNTFVQTGGDDGVVTGTFFGESHEAMGGVLERDDLTAAFGGTR